MRRSRSYAVDPQLAAVYRTVTNTVRIDVDFAVTLVGRVVGHLVAFQLTVGAVAFAIPVVAVIGVPVRRADWLIQPWQTRLSAFSQLGRQRLDDLRLRVVED